MPQPFQKYTRRICFCHAPASRLPGPIRHDAPDAVLLRRWPARTAARLQLQRVARWSDNGAAAPHSMWTSCIRRHSPASARQIMTRRPQEASVARPGGRWPRAELKSLCSSAMFLCSAATKTPVKNASEPQPGTKTMSAKTFRHCSAGLFSEILYKTQPARTA